MDSGDLIAVDDVLAELEGCQELTGTSDPKCASGLRPQMIAVLSAAAPVYRAFGGKTTIAPIARGSRPSVPWWKSGAFAWPMNSRALMNVGPAGAFRWIWWLCRAAWRVHDAQPLHLLISSRDPRNQGNAGVTPFEILFNEASHGVAVPVLSAISGNAASRGN